MAILDILKFPEKSLLQPSTEVDEIDDDIKQLTKDMGETMFDAPGVGLAAPQIGVSKRVIVFDAGDGPHVVVNPELVETDGSWEFEEGCLSVPEKFWPITRPGFARVRGVDLDGAPVDHSGDELLGRVLQHEVDHLAGILLLERLPQRVRKQALRQLREEALGLSTPE